MGLAAAITNLGKYQEGVLAYVWLDLPATDAELDAALRRVGVGSPDTFGIPYEEWFVTDYDDNTGLAAARALGEFPSLEKMNAAAEFAEQLESADVAALRSFCLDHDLCLDDYGLEEIFEADDDVLVSLVKAEVDAGIARAIIFLSACADAPRSEYFRINGSGNLSPFSASSQDLKDMRRWIFADAVEQCGNKSK